MAKYGVKSGDWIRKLGKRMLKFDFKGYSHEKKWVKIGEGDEDWPDVPGALDGRLQWLGHRRGLAAARKELKDIADRMNRCLGLSNATLGYGVERFRRRKRQVPRVPDGKPAGLIWQRTWYVSEKRCNRAQYSDHLLLQFSFRQCRSARPQSLPTQILASGRWPRLD